jgi:hypothetical protein
MTRIEIIGSLVLERDREGKLLQATSYSATLFCRDSEGRGVLNVTKYSNTTSKHQALVKRALGMSEKCATVTNAARDATPGELVELAKAGASCC